MNQAIASIIKGHIEGLDFVDKIAGLTSVLTFDITATEKATGTKSTVQKSFPVACCVSNAQCVKDGMYEELMPNSIYDTVIYFEDGGVTKEKTESNWIYYRSTLRLVCWINVAKILGDDCNDGTACTLSSHLIVEIIRALPKFPAHHSPFNHVFSEITNQLIRSPSIFSAYTYDEKHSQYLMYPYDYFALDISTAFAVCLTGTGVYDSDCGHNTGDVLAAPVAVAGSGVGGNDFTANWNAVTGASGYTIDVSDDAGFTDFVSKDVRLGNVLTVAITGLAENTNYYYRVRAYNDYTESGNSNVITVVLMTTDADGNIYTSVIIGTQEWLIENLKTTKYRDGTPIPYITLAADWITEDGTLGHNGAYCPYNNDPLNIPVYGLLYNWFAVDNIKGLAPTGWRIATSADYSTLHTFIGGIAVAGGKLKEMGITHWTTPNTGATDDYGFKSVPSGMRAYDTGGFNSIKNTCYIWSATATGVPTATMITMIYDGITSSPAAINKKYGMSIRCMRNI